MSEFYAPKIYEKINSDNYLINSYEHLTRIKTVHFLFILIEIIINTIQELEIFLRDLSSKEIKNNFNYISRFVQLLDTFSNINKFLIIILFMLVFDFIFVYLRKKRFKKKYIIVAIMINILELIYFRPFMLIYLDLLFSLPDLYFLFAILFFIPHFCLTINHFLYDHLYYYVPQFINYPYDEFSSTFDIILFFIKIFLSASLNADIGGLGKFFLLIFYFMQFFFCIYFVIKLKNNSYLFMKNSFLNETKFCFFLIKSIVIALALLLGKNEIMNILFFIICIVLMLVLLIYIYIIYNPLYHVKINKETPMGNLFFYLYILSDRDKIDFLFKNKINEHYEKCGCCELCIKYIQYINTDKEKISKEEENESFVNFNNNNFKLLNLFNIIYDGEKKYFQLIKKITIDYKNKGKEVFINNFYYYINLSFLIYSDYQKNNITLSLNEKLILEVINKENKLFDNHETQINQILFCNKFISLSNKILTELKNILKVQQNITKAEKLIEISILLKKMKNPKFKKNLLNHKQENISNSKNSIMACSIIYEEIFNEALNSSQIPIRENILQLEDIFLNNTKADKIISLLIDLSNNNCKILRAGKELSIYKDNDLFNLFPLIFKEYQIKLFFSTIFKNFDISKKKNEDIKNLNYAQSIKDKKDNVNISRKSTNKLRKIKPIINNNNNNKNENVEIKVIICQNISSKIYYKLLIMKIKPLFCNDFNNFFLIFDGFYFLQNYTLITIQDFEESLNPMERLISVSDPNLESTLDIYYMPFKKYTAWQSKMGFNVNFISKFNLQTKLYCIYKIMPTTDKITNKLDGNLSPRKKNNSLIDNSPKNKTNKIDHIIDDTGSVSSQMKSNNMNGGINGLGARNKKKDNTYEYKSLNKIKTIILLSIPIIILFNILQAFNLKSEQSDNSKNNYNYLEFREIFQLYYQIFTSVLGITCIQNENKCKSLLDFFSDGYDFAKLGGPFDFDLFITGQSQILADKMMNKRNNLVNIHKNIGDQKYSELFGQVVNYTRLTQNIVNNTIYFNITYMNIQFSEAILIICNSFQIITNTTIKELIIFLNKIDEPFSFLHEFHKDRKELSIYQKEIYEMILNYKIFRHYLNSINKDLNEILESKTKYLRFLMILYFHLDLSFILYIIILLYIYLSHFENILVKILNYVNMIINIRNDNFNFSKSFSQKLENLEIIIQIYNGNPVKAVQNLTNLYYNHQQYLNAQNKIKNKGNEFNKKSYKKISNSENEKSEMDNIPKNQRLVRRKDIKSLNITNIYLIPIIIGCVLLIILYLFLIILWQNYFSLSNYLYSLIKKNLSVEASLYKSINFYDLMIFQSYPLDDLSSKVFYQYTEGDNNGNSIITSFYKDVQNTFNNQNEKDHLKKIYSDFGDKMDFTCENLYEDNNDKIEELKMNSESKKIDNLKHKLIKLCENSRFFESNDIITALQKHYQTVKNGVISLSDFSYNGLIEHIKTGNIGKATAFFNCILIYVIEVINNQPHKKGIDNLLNLLNRNLFITLIILVGLNLSSFILSLFFYISNIKNYCNQFFLLKNIFKIFENQDQ